MAALFPEEYSFSHMKAAAIRLKAIHNSGICGIAIDSNTGKIYFAANNACVTIFSDTLEFLKSFTLENVVSPGGVVIHNDSLYMTDTIRHSVFHFKVTGNSLDFINEVGGKGSGIGGFIVPRQLDASINGHVYVSDCYNNRIKVLDENLHYIRRISHRYITRPSDFKLTPDKVYVLCNSNTLTIHVFSHFGDKIQSLILKESRTGTRFDSSRFSLDSRSNFVITDSLSDIQIFSKEGKLIHTLGSYELGLKSLKFDPRFIAAQTVNAKLLVFSKYNNQSSTSKPRTSCEIRAHDFSIITYVQVKLYSL